MPWACDWCWRWQDDSLTHCAHCGRDIDGTSRLHPQKENGE